MALSSSSIKLKSDDQLKSLGSYFKSLVTTSIDAEKQTRLNKLTSKRDTLSLKKSMFTDMRTMMDALRTQVKSLLSTDSSYALSSSARKATVSNTASGLTVLSASVDSTAQSGAYQITNINLATTHRVISDRKATSSEAANAGGTMLINGTSISVDSTDSLMGIASKINSATFETGKGVSASVVDNHLVLESKTSGTDGNMTLSGLPLQSLGVVNSSDVIVPANQLAAGLDGSLKINGMSVAISKNKDLTDIITGVTLNLATDAQGQSATLTVDTNLTSMKNSITSFTTKYNTLSDYLGAKTGTTKVDDTHYTRGALADDYSVRSLRGEMLDQLNTPISSGAYKSLQEIGITVNEKMQLTVSDSTKLETALSTNMDAVKTLLDSKMSSMDSMLGRYTDTTSGSLGYTMTSIEDESKQLESSISRETDRLNTRQMMLIQQYTDMQNQLAALQNTTTTLNAMYAAGIGYGSSNSSSSNTNWFA